MPMVFVAVGFSIESAGLGYVPKHISHSSIHTIAEFTLILVLFSDAVRIDTKRLFTDHDIPLRMLNRIGMPGCCGRDQASSRNADQA